MICKENDPRDDTETDHAYNHLSDQEAYSDFLLLDLNSEPGLDGEDSLFGIEWLDNLSILDHVVLSMQEVEGKTCSCISLSLYDCIFKKVTMAKKNLRVGQADGTSLGLIGLVKLLIELNNTHFKHLIIVCQNLKQPLHLSIDFLNDTKLELIGIILEYHT